MALSPINIKDYTYDLPEDRIPLYPLPQREKAKLLHYKNGRIEHLIFSQLTDLLTNNTTLFFNDTKVIPARFTFEKETGASIEVFLLQPIQPSPLLSAALSTTTTTTWKCAIGNLKRWPDGLVLKKETGSISLTARLKDRSNCAVEFNWTPADKSFAEILHATGAVPLPPYIKRKAEASDVERYQTVYSQIEGAVAAPTAGLHFTDTILEEIRRKGIITDFLTLHVSAGTFMPVKEENALDHSMHTEQIVVNRKNIENLLLPGRKVIAVGTTAMRTLESLYWFGVQLLKEPTAPFEVTKLQPYQMDDIGPSAKEALTAVLKHMEASQIDELTGHTSIFIFPGYQFKLTEGLITNFHQPGSTLLLLIAAFIGPDWKKVYQEARDNGYRFLSYGDSSLLSR
jgi:S-adenosylmethionine:tRNA ribosyltransferase-isomerase